MTLPPTLGQFRLSATGYAMERRYVTVRRDFDSP